MKNYFYKVSIIVRTRNEVQWISRCLNEIYNQKYKNFEVILVDHQSTDKTILLGVAEPASDNRKRKLPIPDGALERLWNLFPRKVGKGRAMKLLEQAIRAYADEWELPEMDSAVEVFREHIARMADQYRNKEQQYIPHPATWISQQRYLDPVPEAR